MTTRCYRTEPGSIVLAARVTPNAAADRIEGTETRDDGTCVLRMRVRAVPDKGRANAAVVTLLARTLGIPKSAIALVSGETARLKAFRLAGDPAALAATLDALAASWAPNPR